MRIERFPLGRQLPVSVIGAAKQLGRFGIAADRFGLVVPFDLAIDEHGDQPEMTGNGRMVSSLDRRDGGLPGFDAIDEVLPVVVGMVEFDLVFVCRNLGKPIGLGRVMAAPVDPNPTFSANPFGPALDVRVAPRNGHLDILWVL